MANVCATFILGNLVFVFSDLTTPPYDATDNQLIGTSKERSLLNNEINASYQRSLQLDEDKEKEKIADEKIANRRIALMNERKKRVPDEPNFGVDIAVVKIRHHFLVLRRAFSMVIHMKIPIHLRKFMIGWAALAKHQNTSILSITVEKEYHQKKKFFREHLMLKKTEHRC